MSILTFPQPASAESTNQRVSYAISGGASKGAYEAGLNWAILQIMRYETGASYKDQVLKGKYRPFEAVSMTGASAGGINAILSAMAWCARPDAKGGITSLLNDNIFRNLWLAPDINTLLPPTARSPIYQFDDAVLARKSLIVAAEKLRELWDSPVFRKDCRVPLGVTVTRVQPEELKVGDIKVKNQRFTFPFELRTHDDGTAGFYFDPKDFPLLLDYSMILIPYEADAPKLKIDNARIEEVVMTSAAFPVAFGRKRLQHCRIKATYEKDIEEPKAEIVDKPQQQKSGPVCPEGYELTTAEFADGGLFDNLPIGLARTLAEENKRSKQNPLPVTYIYIDPNRLRYALPEKEEFEKCLSENPPKACEELDYSFMSESRLLRGALGSAQNYELYRELTSDTWSHNLSQLAYQTAELFEEIGYDQACSKEVPFFTEALSCAAAVRYAGRFLEVSYDRIDAPITPPFSVKKLQQAGLVKRCRETETDSDVPVEAECYIDFIQFRKDLVQRLLTVLRLIPDHNSIMLQRVQRSQYSIHNDRIIRVTSRGAPITGELLESFAAFLDFKFREYDYLVGVYDAIVEVGNVVCRHHYSQRRQPEEFQNCHGAISKRLYKQLGVKSDKKAAFVFASLAKKEFANQEAFQFAFDPMPEEDRDMRIIHEGLWKTLVAKWEQSLGFTEASSSEVEFFKFLKEQGFTPTPTDDGSNPLLADIMLDPDLWAHELTRRFTDRLMALEKDAARIYAEREPDPKKRPETNEGLMGGTSFVLRSTTYKYPEFDFAPSTAPKEWKSRYVIPYEIGFDLVEGHIMFVWQPTWSLAKYDLLNIRGTVGLAKGIIGEASHEARENYLSLGLGYTRLTSKGIMSNYGITPGYYRTFLTSESGGKESFGGEVHVSILENKIRFGLGARDFESTSDSWYLSFGITDIPGIIYWFTR
ncbi:patatin-like phospholipase family protein [Kaarinaea lacus]